MILYTHFLLLKMECQVALCQSVLIQSFSLYWYRVYLEDVGRNLIRNVSNTPHCHTVQKPQNKFKVFDEICPPNKNCTWILLIGYIPLKLRPLKTRRLVSARLLLWAALRVIKQEVSRKVY
jgi:hypothetical protein